MNTHALLSNQITDYTKGYYEYVNKISLQIEYKNGNTTDKVSVVISVARCR